MNPIQLTRKMAGKGVPSFVNPDLIACLNQATDNDDTIVSFASGWTIYVAETPEQIVGRLRGTSPLDPDEPTVEDLRERFA